MYRYTCGYFSGIMAVNTLNERLLILLVFGARLFRFSLINGGTEFFLLNSFIQFFIFPGALDRKRKEGRYYLI